MKKRLCLLGLVLMLGAMLVLPTLGGLADGDPYKVYVLNKNASLWPEKQAKGEAIVKKVGIDYAVTVLERDGEWTKVELLDGRQGYMLTYYLGGKYKISLGERAYAMRQMQTNRNEFSTVSFDRSSGEQLTVLWEEGDWLYVIELKDGLGGYIPKDTNYTIIEYP